MRLSRRMGWVGPAAVLGGLLWVPYGVFEMLQPWGTDTVYQDDRGYEIVTNTQLYLLYSLPGSAALLLTSLGLLGVITLLRLTSGRLGKLGLILAYIAVALAILSAVGVIALFDPLFTSGRIFGSLALGAATFAAGISAWRVGAAPGWAVALLVLGVMGVLLFPLWPLVYALRWVSEGAGAAFMALFGLGWLLLGYGLWARASGSSL